MTFDEEKYKQIALKILTPIKPINKGTWANKDFLLSAKRSKAGHKLPVYYLIYFLFNNLLEFKNIGQSEKVAWSFPIDYKGRAFLIEYRKLGVGVFVHDLKKDEKDAEEIVAKINEAVKRIGLFYDYLAQEAVLESKFNIVNNNRELYQRFQYLLSLYRKELNKYIKNEDKVKIEKKTFKDGTIATSYKNIGTQYHQNANWIAISCIDAFFSWTEHLFIHLAVVAENLSSGEDISKLIGAEWKDKFKAAIKSDSKEANKYYNDLLIIRQQLRNFVAHGAFGKDGNAFQFHSGTGAVPVLMTHKKKKNKFSLYGYLTFNEEDVIKLIEDFIKFIWRVHKPAMFYTQECSLPTILTNASNGIYKAATKDIKSMEKYAHYLTYQLDNAANMDW